MIWIPTSIDDWLCELLNDYELPKNIARELELSRRRGHDSRRSRVRLSVIDTGPGISSEVLPPHIEPLFTTKNFGAGLGLPAVRQIVDQQSGTIEVESAVEVGTTAMISLPRQARAAPPTGREAAA